MKHHPSKFALVSHVLPPSASGQAVVLHRLLHDLDARHCCVLSTRDYPPEEHDPDPSERATRRLACDYIHLPPDGHMPLRHTLPMRLLVRGVDGLAGGLRRTKRAGASLACFGRSSTRNPASFASSPAESASTPSAPAFAGSRAAAARAPQYVDDWLSIGWRTQVRARAILEAVRRHGCAAVVACSGDLIDMPAAHLASREAGLPFHAYVFDDYATQWVPPFQRAFAERSAAAMFRDAASVMVPNEFLARVYRTRYGIEPVIVPNPAEIGPRPGPPPQMGRPIRIVYTGSIYDAHHDAFRSLLDAIRGWNELPVELHVYTSNDARTLEKLGVTAPAILHPGISAREAAQKQREADIVFLPLAFHSPIPEVINTSAPGKMGELLSCGRPILAHAPREAFVSWYVRTHDCGAVVDVQDRETLRGAIRRLDADPAAIEGLVDRAYRRAEIDFSVEVAQDRFLAALSERRDRRRAS